jgi:hypothetical protein
MLRIRRENFLTALLIVSFFSTVMEGCESLYERHGLNKPSNFDSKEEEISFVAEVILIPLEGGFYGLLAEDGRRFLPLNLPEGFRREGLKVRVRGEMKKNVATIYMWGTPFEIHEIEVFSP